VKQKFNPIHLDEKKAKRVLKNVRALLTLT